MNLASTYADDKTFCTVVLTSQEVMVQSLLPNVCEFESMCVLVFFYLYSICLNSFIIDVPRPQSNDLWMTIFEKVDV